jgi:hypothetical protein
MKISRTLPFVALWSHALGYSLFSNTPSEKVTDNGEYETVLICSYLTILQIEMNSVMSRSTSIHLN